VIDRWWAGCRKQGFRHTFNAHPLENYIFKAREEVQSPLKYAPEEKARFLKADLYVARSRCNIGHEKLLRDDY
jgi:hypothetical protein